MAVAAALGFASGVPLLLTGQVLNAWLTDAGITIKTIALFASVGLPYTLKFLWAPLLDRYTPPFLGRRRGWMLITQVGLVGAIAAMAFVDPTSTTLQVAQLAIAIAALSATQDVAIDAWRADVFLPEERAAGSASYVFGYRVAMLVVGTVGLILADHTSFQVVYLGAAALMALSIAATLLAEEPAQPAARPHTIVAALWMPFVEFGRRLGWAALAGLGFAALYKFGDQMVDGLLTTFWLRELELSKTVMATFNKAAGFGGVVVGGILAGVLAPRLGTRRALLAFGVLQASTNLLYIALVAYGPSYVLVGTAIFVDQLANMMGTAAFMAVLMALCNKEVSATQFALLTSLSSVGKRVFGWVGGDLVASYGWEIFFGATAALAIPGLLLVRYLPDSVITPPRPKVPRATLRP